MPKLPDNMPVSMAKLPVNHVGYPVPWFVWFDPRTGEPDFRVIRERGIEKALLGGLCWVCGDPMGRGMQAFVIGPMCAINRTSAEPPSHYQCAKWSAIACPFLANPKMVRRDKYEFEHGGTAGFMIDRNPGVAGVWKCRRGAWAPFQDGLGGTLIHIGTPMSVEWYAQGRTATRDEVMYSIDTGYPILMEHALAQDKEEGGTGSVKDLEGLRRQAIELLPAA